MKIIDKGNRKDFYDYIQHQYPDNSITFDRRKACVFDKAFFSSWVNDKEMFDRSYGKFVLCIGYTRWLFSIKDLKWESTGMYSKQLCDYKLTLLKQWKDYKTRVFMKVLAPRITWEYKNRSNDEIVEAIDKGYIELRELNSYGWSSFSDEHGIILKDGGFASIVKPEDVYYSLEEYFNSLATEREGGPSKDLTDIDRVVNHGFDKKTSFRGR